MSSRSYSKQELRSLGLLPKKRRSKYPIEDVEDFPVWYEDPVYTDEEIIRLLELRLCKNRDLKQFHRQCGNCDSFVLDEKGNKKVFRECCGILYCDDSYCYKTRFERARFYYNAMVWGMLGRRGFRRKAHHHSFSMGHYSKEELTPDLFRELSRRLNACLKEIRKKIKRNFLSIGVLDKSITEDGKFHLHYHILFRLYGFLNEDDLKQMDDICLEYGIVNKVHSFKDETKKGKEGCIGNMINYFAKRWAGNFEHEKNGNDWSYSDHFTIKEFFDTFQHVHRAISFGFKKGSVGKIKQAYIKFLESKPQLTESELLSCNYYTQIIKKTCENCGSKCFHHVNVDDGDLNLRKPPPDISKQP